MIGSNAPLNYLEIILNSQVKAGHSLFKIKFKNST